MIRRPERIAASEVARVSTPRRGDHYYGLVAAGYDAWLAGVDFGDDEAYRRLIAAAGGRALELACGTGRLLIPYRREGLDVEGLDASAAMLAICRRKARAAGVAVQLHHAAMENFTLPGHYALIYCAVGSLMLLADEQAIGEAVATARRHLHGGGILAVSLERPRSDEAELAGAPRLRRETPPDRDGVTTRVWERRLAPPRPEIERSELIYEVVVGDRVVASQTELTDLRPFQPDAFAAVLAAQGFVGIDCSDACGMRPVAPGDAGYLAVARRPRAD